MKAMSRKWLTYKSYSYLRLICKSLQMKFAMTTLRAECLSSTASSFDTAFARFNQRGSALAKAPELQLSLAAFRRASHYANKAAVQVANCTSQNLPFVHLAFSHCQQLLSWIRSSSVNVLNVVGSRPAATW
jgi:hypothetical protein